jgi:hypothetical protein
MPHTHSRYQQDLGFNDGIIDYSVSDVVNIASAGGPATLVRNGPADIVINVPNSTTVTLSIPLFETLILRTGFFEDTQNIFGSTFGGGVGALAAGPGGAGTGIPASAEPQGRPDTFGTEAALQQLTPRTALKLKGIKTLSLAVKYKVLTNPATVLTMRADEVNFVNGVANNVTPVIATGANGLTNVAAATPYVITVPFPVAEQTYQIDDLTEIWFELAVQTPANGTVQFYGVRLACEFNYN